MGAGKTMAFALAAVLMLPALIGCGGKPTVQVRGSLQQNGQPYQLAQDEQVQITFSGDGADGVPFSASTRVKQDSTFVLSGPANRGVPPGTYKITMSAQIYGPKNEGDRFLGTFSDETSPLTYTATSDAQQEIVVDVVKKTVTKK
jgi:hypothetical protein